MTAVQNRRLIEEDVTVELEFRADSDEACLVWLAQACDCRMEIVGSVDLGEDVLQYLAVDGASVEAVADAAVGSDTITGARVIRAEGKTPASSNSGRPGRCARRSRKSAPAWRPQSSRPPALASSSRRPVTPTSGRFTRLSGGRTRARRSSPRPRAIARSSTTGRVSA